MADKAISEFSSYSPSLSGQILVLDTTTSTTKRVLVPNFAEYVLGDIVSIIDGGDHQSVYLAEQDMTGGTATTP